MAHTHEVVSSILTPATSFARRGNELTARLASRRIGVNSVATLKTGPLIKFSFCVFLLKPARHLFSPNGPRVSSGGVDGHAQRVLGSSYGAGFDSPSLGSRMSSSGPLEYNF